MREKIILALILLTSVVLRLWNLDSIPNGFHRDEAFYGYEAYSILKTGRDEHGLFMPTYFRGFGMDDYPLGHYPRVPFIAIFGLNPFAVRLSVAFYGIVTIFLVYLLTRKMFASANVALLATALFAFSTWHFFMSRYPPSIIALMFLVLGIYLLFYRKGKLVNILGGISLGLTCFTYASHFFFTPPFLLLLLVVFWQRIKKGKNVRVGYIAAVVTTVLAFVLLWNANFHRAAQSAFYNDSRNIEYAWGDKPVGERFALGGSYDVVERYLHDPRLGYVHKLISNYLDGFSVNFWLKTGRGFESNLEGFGNLLVYEPFLALVGMGYLFWKRSKLALLFVGWILLGPLASTFTKDVSSTRMVHMIPPIVFLQATALYYLTVDILKFRFKILAYLAIAAIFVPIIFFNFYYYDAYFRHFSAYSGKWWQNGYRQVVELTNQYPEKQIYVDGKWDFSYLHFVFWNKYDPAKFQKEAKWEEGIYNFNTVTDIGRYHFIDKLEEGMLCQNYDSIYIKRYDYGNKLPEYWTGVIAPLGSDQFAYFIPTEENCQKFKS